MDAGEGGVVIVTLSRARAVIFHHAGDELIAKDWDRAAWGEAGPGTLEESRAMNRTERRDGTSARIVLGVLTIGGLMAATFWILSPFLGAIIWAVMIVVATWSLMLGVQGWAGNRRWIAVTIMSLPSCWC